MSSEKKRASRARSAGDSDERKSPIGDKVARDDAASPDAGEKKVQKSAPREDDPPVVAAIQEKAPPMSSTSPSTQKQAAPAAGPEDPVYAFFRNLKVPSLSLPEEKHAESPFSSSKPLLPDTGPGDPVGHAAQVLGKGLKALASWRVVDRDGPASEADPLWANLKSVLTWKAPEAKREVKLNFDTEPTFNVDRLLSAWTKSHPDRRR